jgi:cytochrome c biogenesis protein
MAVDTQLSEEPTAVPPPLGPVATLRWAWRQLTSMRTALFLLFLLAVAAIPGSLIPQKPVDPIAVGQFHTRHPGLARWYERLSLFEVFSSPWFSAIYLLLMISLVGCVVPRSKVYLAAVRARPPAAPRYLDRLPENTRVHSDLTVDQVLDACAGSLRKRRFRVDRHGDGTVSAERGYLRDTGNLVFHLSLVVVLVGIAYGHLYGFKGSALVVEGEGFANTITQYDNVHAGPRYDVDHLPPFALTLDQFNARYQSDGQQIGAARSFSADVSYTPAPGEPTQHKVIKVNHPLHAGNTKVYLGPHGYAPVVTVRDGGGSVVFSGPVPFLPTDPVGLSSRGVVKVPDAQPTQLGFQGFFLPTAARDTVRGLFSLFPAPKNPRLVLNAWTGDLGLDDGVPQSVYRLNTEHMTQVRATLDASAPATTAALAIGETMNLPRGLGSLTFDGYRQWVVLQLADDPGRRLTLLGAALAILGLLGSLFVRPRRLWVRATADGAGRTVVDVGALARSDGPDLAADVAGVVDAVRAGPPASSTIDQRVNEE